MHWQERWRFIVAKTQLLNASAELEGLLEQLTHPTKVHVLGFVNAHAMNSMAASENFYHALHSADTLLRDGSGMAVLYRRLHMAPGLNLNGTDLIPQIIEKFNGRPIALYGTREPFLSAASHAIALTLAPNSSVQIVDGFSEVATYLEQAQAQRPALIVLGMGMPKQELLAHQLRSHLDFPCLIVCGGAILDFLGGKTQRAPNWLRRLGMEWVYRLIVEPRRLFYRYVIGNPLFLWRTANFQL